VKIVIVTQGGKRQDSEGEKEGDMRWGKVGYNIFR
jgi:hypothetical protein